MRNLITEVEAVRPGNARRQSLLHTWLTRKRVAAKGRGVQAQVEIAIDQFLHKNWPFGAPKPTVYVDPRTSAVGQSLREAWLRGGLNASMHAKCIIIDQQRVLVGSANFTNRGQHRNVEVGALIDSPSFAKQLVTQGNALIAEGALVVS